MAVDQLRNNRAVGPNNIQAACIKFGKPILLNALRGVQSTQNRKNKRGKGRRHNVSSTHKGDPLECLNCRVITLLNTAYEIFSNILYNSLQSCAKKIIGNYQCHLKKGKYITDHVHAFRQTPENARKHKISTYHLSVDFEATYASINGDQLLIATVEFKIPKKIN
jgi:sorting nexin-29